ncbi:MAG: NAD(P)H-dependent oxidoreductase [Saccharospirillaceae bacterium]|nr:NADPH-dependent FMN reductase [Thalassolituus sp. HI0120]MCH2039198.1 NAD(P)H-dependent oxidoreductase [Saccharospirillaceae bacterium]
MKVLAFAASNSSQSINKALVTHAAELLQNNTGAEFEVLDLNDFEMPIYSSDRENESGIPAPAQAFRKKIGEADVILISFAEYNGSYTAAYKNVFDWTSRIDQKVYQNKKAVLLATSPGQGGAQSVLNSAVGSAPYFALDVKGSLSVPSFYDNFDSEQGVLTNDELSQQLIKQLSLLSEV